MKERTLALVALAAVCLFWGTTYLAIRLAVNDLPPALFCAVRFAIAGAAMLALSLARGERLPRDRDWFDLAVVAVLLLAVGNGTLAWALRWVPTGVASLIIVTTPLWMASFAWLGGEDVRGRTLGGLLLGFAGLAFVLWPKIEGAQPGSHFLEGAGAILASSAVWALGSVYSKKRAPRTAPLMSAAVQMLMGSVLFSIVGLLLGESARWHATPTSWLAVAYLVLFGSIVGYGSYIYALAKLPTAQVAVYAYVNPLVAILLGISFLGEPFEPAMRLGVPLVLLGVFLVNTHGAAPAAADTALPLRVRLLRRLWGRSA